MAEAYYDRRMKTLTVRVPAALVADLDAESRRRRLSRSEVVRDRLRHPAPSDPAGSVDPLAGLRDLIGSARGLPRDLSARKKHYLKRLGYGQNRAGR